MEKQNSIHTSPATSFPPVVSVLGHVDHGKTTLLDAIRKTNIATHEAGGITQKIGASHIEITHEGKRRFITFIDTPGHAAFANMRSQGVSASDIVLLVIAADDGIKPQTEESIKKILEAKVPFIVVFTKSDAPGANIERVKQQVLSTGILLEGLGGEVPYIAVSAKTGDKIRDLLDLIILVYDLSGIKKTKDAEFLGVVIESKLDKRRGSLASIVIKQGILKVSETLFVGQKEVGRARALFNPHGTGVKQAGPGDAVEILGLTEVLPAGSLLRTKQEAILPEVAPAHSVATPSPHDLAAFFSTQEKDAVRIILKTETSGEADAVRNSLPSDIEVVFQGQGDISVSDILLAKDFAALVLGFAVDITREAKVLAENEQVFYKTYKIIYELLDEISDVQKALAMSELPVGQAQIIASFEGSAGKILGVKVLDGEIRVNDRVTLVRGEKEIGKSKIVTLKRGKEDAREVKKGFECGLMLAPVLDFSIGDMLLSHNKT